MFPRISETFILDEIRALVRHGVPVRIYALHPPGRDARVHPEAEALAAGTIVLADPSRAALRGALADLSACLRAHPRATLRVLLRTALRPGPRSFRRLARAARLAALLRRDGVAHLHAAWAHSPASVARIASILTGIPWSMTAHAKDLHLSRPPSLRKKIASARFVLACTGGHRDLLRRIGSPGAPGLPEPRVLLLHHGVDTRRFAPHADRGRPGATAARTPLVLSVGRLVHKKGFDVLLEAFALLRRLGVGARLEIVGEGPLRPDLERRVADLGLGDSVVLHGLRVRHEVLEAYRRADCVVLASRVTAAGDRDGIPNTLAEAMACGLPVVAARLPGTEELVVDGETGLLVPPEQPEALALALESVLRDPERRRRMGEAGRERVRRHFDGGRWGELAARRFASAMGIERVLYVSPDRGVPARGSKGASVHLRAVVGALRSLGAEPLVLTTRPGPETGPSVPAAVMTTGAPARLEKILHRLGRAVPCFAGPFRNLLRLLDNLWIYRDGLRRARAWHADVLYERYALFSCAGSFVARRLGVPHVLEVNAPLADEEARFRGLRLRGPARLLERFILRRADRLVVVSRAIERHARALGVAPERIAVLPNGVDPQVFHPGRDGGAARRLLGLDGALVVGFAGSLKPWHGVHHLLRAAALAAGDVPALRLLIVGEGPERDRLGRLAVDLGLADRVVFAGAVPHEDVAGYLAACDVLVAPYGPMERFYFSPLKVAEYHAVGRPVVVSAVGEPGEAPGATGGALAVPPGDEAALARALVDLARDAALRERLGRAAAAARPWTWEDVARRILEDAEAIRRRLWGWRA
jgi:glycosyltransferase involved in cell wall biosynthesis